MTARPLGLPSKRAGEEPSPTPSLSRPSRCQARGPCSSRSWSSTARSASMGTTRPRSGTRRSLAFWGQCIHVRQRCCRRAGADRSSRHETAVLCAAVAAAQARHGIDKHASSRAIERAPRGAPVHDLGELPAASGRLVPEPSVTCSRRPRRDRRPGCREEAGRARPWPVPRRRPQDGTEAARTPQLPERTPCAVRTRVS